jgi:hypothetical protein
MQLQKYRKKRNVRASKTSSSLAEGKIVALDALLVDGVAP